MKTCKIDGCDVKFYAKGLCEKHYARLRRIGSLDLIGKDYEKHDYVGTSEYNTWSNMRRRCNNVNDKYYKNYGGRGISVCDEWNNSFLRFIEDMGNKPNPNYSIDRIDNNKGYYKENCRWADRTTQNNNQRVRKDNKSGVKGVFYDNARKVWTSVLYKNKKRVHIMNHKTKEEAIKYRLKAELEYNRKF
jgi:hypothetical protein